MGTFEKMRDAAIAFYAEIERHPGGFLSVNFDTDIKSEMDGAIDAWHTAGCPGPEGEADVEGIKLRRDELIDTRNRMKTYLDIAQERINGLLAHVERLEHRVAGLQHEIDRNGGWV